ncbi:MAG TPA: hypothetical protein V6C72_02020 [Chroococcales cyanobacterium]
MLLRPHPFQLSLCTTTLLGVCLGTFLGLFSWFGASELWDRRAAQCCHEPSGYSYIPPLEIGRALYDGHFKEASRLAEIELARTPSACETVHDCEWFADQLLSLGKVSEAKATLVGLGARRSEYGELLLSQADLALGNYRSVISQLKNNTDGSRGADFILGLAYLEDGSNDLAKAAFRRSQGLGLYTSVIPAYVELAGLSKDHSNCQRLTSAVLNYWQSYRTECVPFLDITARIMSRRGHQTQAARLLDEKNNLLRQ